MSSAPLFPAMAQDAQTRVLSVTGEGSESIPTTLTQISLGVEVQGKTAAEVQQQAAEQTTAVLEAVRSQPIDQLETTGISLRPIYAYENGQELTGYQATNTISFEIPTEQAGTILDSAVQAGATRINSVSFIAADDAIAAARQQALQIATRNAQEQAGAVLSSLNFTAQEIVGIQIDQASAPPPRPLPFANEAADTVSQRLAETPVVGSEQTVRATVTLQIRY
ncbi:SIMPL domain-containing protein [Vasconcelosia minhoensis]|uniref:SIMPL domain-containing protein n=1 Tax=Vasconcelosia minhoensis TaxID=3366354 RepID=UPI001D13EB65|nr:SIMPL domain-containing protein [Romeria gracilis]